MGPGAHTPISPMIVHGMGYLTDDCTWNGVPGPRPLPMGLLGYGVSHRCSTWDGLRSLEENPLHALRFIPRARARGHARTLRARALYGMAKWAHSVYTL